MSKAHRRFKIRHILLGILALVVVLLIAARLYLNVWLLDYVNKTLQEMEGYTGSVEAIDIELYRGAYRIHNLKILKENGKIPTPFVNIRTVDLSIEWGALFKGKIVSNIDLDRPVINFAKAGGAVQTGEGANWTETIDDLMPIDINRVTFTDGKLTYQDFSASPKVNVYIHDMSGEVTNLRNVDDKNDPLPSTLVVRGSSIGKGQLEMRGRLNALREVPDMGIDAKLEKVHLPALNDYTKAYGGFDIEAGSLNIYAELIVKDKRISGYVKPIATKVKLPDLKKDSDNPVELVWESVVAAVTEVFTNQPDDQFATRVPLTGNLDNVDTDTWTTIGGIIRNAFVSAFRNGFDRQKEE